MRVRPDAVSLRLDAAVAGGVSVLFLRTGFTAPTAGTWTMLGAGLIPSLLFRCTSKLTGTFVCLGSLSGVAAELADAHSSKSSSPSSVCGLRVGDGRSMLKPARRYNGSTGKCLALQDIFVCCDGVGFSASIVVSSALEASAYYE